MVRHGPHAHGEFLHGQVYAPQVGGRVGYVNAVCPQERKLYVRVSPRPGGFTEG